MTDLELPDPQWQGRPPRRRVTDLHAELADIGSSIDAWRIADRYLLPAEPLATDHIEMAELRAELGAARRQLLDAIAAGATTLDFQPVLEP